MSDQLVICENADKCHVASICGRSKAHEPGEYGTHIECAFTDDELCGIASSKCIPVVDAEIASDQRSRASVCAQCTGIACAPYPCDECTSCNKWPHQELVKPVLTIAARPKWNHQQAVELCRAIEAICPPFGCHVALTGGCLYKDGERKDCDILFYRIRQVEHIDVNGLLYALRKINIKYYSGEGWCYKFVFNGMGIDCFFPEEDGGTYA